MQRIVEPELMVDPTQAQVYSQADFKASEENLISEISDFLKTSGLFVGSSTLIFDLGCGPGNITQRLSSNWPSSTVIGIDDSTAMLQIAKERQNDTIINSRDTRLFYKKNNISDLAAGKLEMEAYPDLVVSNSLLHHLHDPLIFFKALKKISKRGTLHFHRDLRRPETAKDAKSIQKKYLPDAHPVMVRDFLASLHAAFTPEEISESLQNVGLEHLNVIEVGEKYVDVLGTI